MVALTALVLLLAIGTASGQSYKGCYTGSDGFFTVSGSSLHMTNQDCVEHCVSQDKAYSATGEGMYCACLTDLQNLNPVSDSQCDVSCTGVLTEKCGGSDEIVTVWSTGQGKRELAAKTTSENLRTASVQSYKGCYSGSDGSFTASGSSLHMTNQDCVEHCQALGKAYSATGEGMYCACLTDLHNLNPVSDSQCDVSCTGNQTHNCGGRGDIVTVWSTGQAAKRMLTLKMLVEAMRDTV